MRPSTFAARLRRTVVFQAGAILAFFAVATVPSLAGTMSVAWDKVTDSDLAGYRVYYGTTPGTRTTYQGVTAATTSTVLASLQDCSIYYVAVRAFDGTLESTVDSNALVGYPRPVVTSVTPATIRQGETAVFTVNGTNFDRGVAGNASRPSARVTLSNPGLVVRSTSVTACGQLTVTVEALANAAVGNVSLSVENPDISFTDPQNHGWTWGTLDGAITVQSAAPATSVSASKRVDFGPATVAPAVGHVLDSGLPFDATRGFGWLSGGSLSTRDGSCVTPRQSNLVAADTAATWEIVLPNGDYDVTLSTGDCSSSAGPQQISVEDVPFVSGETTAAAQFLVRYHRVEVRDGRLTVALGAGSLIDYIDIQPSLVQPATLVSVNFQPTVTGAPAGFEADDGSPVGSTGNGWLASQRWGTRKRNINPNPVLDTLVFADKAGATYQRALGQGPYDVTASVGDSVMKAGPQRVIAGTTTILDGDVTTASEFRQRSGRATVGIDGVLNVKVGGRTESSAQTALNFLTIASPTEWHVNFQPATQGVPAGYQADSGLVFTPAAGYGWSTNMSGAIRERYADTEQRRDAFVSVGATAQTWRAQVPVGFYDVTVSVGDSSAAAGPHVVKVEGTAAFAGETTTLRQFLLKTVRVYVADGLLSIAVGGGATGSTALNYVDIVPAPYVKLINFQPAASPTPDGYLADSGRAYTDARGYGWNDDTIFTAGQTRDRMTAAGDAAQDTFVFSSAAAEWRMAVPNGDYVVTVAVGDMSFAQGPHRVVIEGRTLVNDEKNVAGSLIERVSCVRITDGFLNMRIGGAGTANTAVNYLKLETGTIRCR